MQIDRRELLAGSGAAALLASTPALAAAATPSRIKPVAMDRVRLKPSVFADAQRADRAYLASLEPDRLLNRFLRSAGLPAKGDVYGGWEAQSISGHIMGHYLTACALLVANTGDRLIRERLSYTVAELRRAQLAGGDGYIGGTTTW
ncbi:MAG: glycoside hydrolase family 127 protein, partial [Sphingomonadales bacterium]